MRNHVLSALLLCNYAVCATETKQQQATVSPLPLCAPFERFLKAFVGLFKQTSHVAGLEKIEEATTNLLKLALSIMSGYIEPQKPKDGTRCFHDTSYNQYADLVIKHAHGIAPICRRAHAAKKDDDEENQRKILSLFANIVKHFLNIAQDPENRENVVPNLMGMATGIVAIGNEVIRSGNLAADATSEDIEAYVAHLDTTTKQAMIRIVQQKVDELWSNPREL